MSQDGENQKDTPAAKRRAEKEEREDEDEEGGGLAGKGGKRGEKEEDVGFNPRWRTKVFAIESASL